MRAGCKSSTSGPFGCPKEGRHCQRIVQVMRADAVDDLACALG